MSGSDYLLDLGLDGYYLLDNGWNLFYHLLDVWDDLLHLLDLLVYHDFFYLSFNVLDSGLLLFYLDYLFDELRDLDNFLDYLLDHERLFNDNLNRNCDLVRYQHDLLYLNWFDLLVIKRHHFIYMHSFGNLPYNFDNSLTLDILSDYLFNSVVDNNQLIDYSIDRLLNFEIYILDNFYFGYFLLDDWNLNNSFDLFNDYFLDLFYDDFLYNLRNLNNFLDDSRNNHYFFYNPFDLDYFRHFNHFLYDLINLNPNLFDPIDVSGNLNDFLFNVSDWFGDFNVMVDDSLNLNQLGFVNYHWIPEIHLFHDHCLYSLHNRFFNNYLYFLNDLMNDWNFNNLLNLVRHFLNDLNNLFNHNFNR